MATTAINAVAGSEVPHIAQNSSSVHITFYALRSRYNLRNKVLLHNVSFHSLSQWLHLEDLARYLAAAKRQQKRGKRPPTSSTSGQPSKLASTSPLLAHTPTELSIVWTPMLYYTAIGQEQVKRKGSRLKVYLDRKVQYSDRIHNASAILH